MYVRENVLLKNADDKSPQIAQLEQWHRWRGYPIMFLLRNRR